MAATTRILLHPPTKPSPSASNFFTLNPLPKLLHTPTGLAILELQGTINLPHIASDAGSNDPGQDGDGDSTTTSETQLGRLVFPDHHPLLQGDDSTKWMKRVYLYIGLHQRLLGEVKKLPMAIAVVCRRDKERRDDDENGDMTGADELEILDIVKYKLVFSQRPEPVGTS